jgi:Na+/melibiose symporter-like transporter
MSPIQKRDVRGISWRTVKSGLLANAIVALVPPCVVFLNGRSWTERDALETLAVSVSVSLLILAFNAAQKLRERPNSREGDLSIRTRRDDAPDVDAQAIMDERMIDHRSGRGKRDER